MQIHELKTLPVYWDAVKRGEKTFEVRRDDRGFQKGDRLRLIRHNGFCTESARGVDPLHQDSYIMQFEITYILTGGQFGIEPGHVVMGIRTVES